MWASARRANSINNLLSRTLTGYEQEALSLGLKFSTGRGNRDLTDHIVKNYGFSDKEVDKGFIQGVLTCYKAIAASELSSLSKTCMIALEALAKDDYIVITLADKGGGIIIMDKSDYDKKMNDLPGGKNTYAEKKTGFFRNQGIDFNKQARKILKKSERGRTADMFHIQKSGSRIRWIR